MSLREYRCPDCGQYCAPNPLTDEAFCPSDGWFDTSESPHVVEVSP